MGIIKENASLKSKSGGGYNYEHKVGAYFLSYLFTNKWRISNNLFFRQKVLSFRTLSSMYGDFQQLWSQPGISRAL